MKIKVRTVEVVLLMIAIAAVLMASVGCFYPKAERAPGELVSSINYHIDNETTVIEEDSNGRQWIYVGCDYWAGCFMRCDGSSKRCSQLAKDSKFSILSVFKNIFN